MRAFYSFLVIFAAAVLFLLPITEGVYDFRTDQETDTYREETDGATTTANITLTKELYDDDITSVTVLSSDEDDSPVVAGYHSTTRLLDISGLALSTNRTLSVYYDFDALGASDALNSLLDVLGWIWLIAAIGFAPAAIAAMFLFNRGR